jgi:hypothetical protein
MVYSNEYNNSSVFCYNMHLEISLDSLMLTYLIGLSPQPLVAVSSKDAVVWAGKMLDDIGCLC